MLPFLLRSTHNFKFRLPNRLESPMTSWLHRSHLLFNTRAGFKIPQCQLFRTKESPISMYTNVHRSCCVVGKTTAERNLICQLSYMSNFSPFSFPVAHFVVHNQHILFAEEYYICFEPCGSVYLLILLHRSWDPCWQCCISNGLSRVLFIACTTWRRIGWWRSKSVYS